MTNLIKDVSAITNINEKLLNKIVDIAIYCINDAVEESVLNKECITQVDIGIGTLSILASNNELKFKFIPNAKLRESVISTIKNEENTIDKVVESNIVEKLTKLYKDIF